MPTTIKPFQVELYGSIGTMFHHSLKYFDIERPQSHANYAMPVGVSSWYRPSRQKMILVVAVLVALDPSSAALRNVESNGFDDVPDRPHVDRCARFHTRLMLLMSSLQL
jgi:hypothetical protein